MLRRRPEPLAASLFFGALFSGALVMIGHGFVHAIAAPVVAHSAVLARVAGVLGGVMAG